MSTKQTTSTKKPVSKTTSTSKTEVVAAPVIATPAPVVAVKATSSKKTGGKSPQPVIESPKTDTPIASANKKLSKTVKPKSNDAVATAPVQPAVSETSIKTVVAEPAKKTKVVSKAVTSSKGGAGGAVKKSVVETAVPVPVETKAVEAKSVEVKSDGTKKKVTTVIKKLAGGKKVNNKVVKTKKTKEITANPIKSGDEIVNEEGTAENETPGTRFFKVIVNGGEPHGRFSGTKPKQAANKALTSILKTRNQTGGAITGEIKFSIVECTRKSKHKQYNYVGERIKLDKPMKVIIGKGDAAKEIEYKFNNRVMKDKEAVIIQA